MKTIEEKLERFQKHLQKNVSREINRKNYSKHSITIPGSALELEKDGTPYYEEEFEYNNAIKALRNMPSIINNKEIDQAKESLKNLIQEYEPRVNINKLCLKYYQEFARAVISIGNSSDKEDFDRGLKDLIKLSNMKIDPQNIPQLIDYTRIIEDNYARRWDHISSQSLGIKQIEERYFKLKEKYETIQQMCQLGFFEDIKLNFI